MSREVGDVLVEDERFKLLSFTGSPDVGWDMKRRAGMKRVVLELGGNAGVVIDEDADLAFRGAAGAGWAHSPTPGRFVSRCNGCLSTRRSTTDFKDLLIAETKTDEDRRSA